MRHWMVALALGALVLGGAAPAGAQFAAEVRLDAAIPVDEDGADFDTGVGFGLRASLDVAPTFAVYGGFSRFEFDVEDRLPGVADLETETFELGGRVGLGTPASPYFMLGAIFQEDEDTGIEAGLGAEYNVSWQLSLTPEVRYRNTFALDYITLGMGARFRF